VHVDDVPRAGALVQVVDVLGDEDEAAGERALQPCQCIMRGIRRDARKAAPPLIVEVVDEAGIAGESLRCRHVAIVHLRPDAALVAERVDAGFR
jgi:hypothetical protein